MSRVYRVSVSGSVDRIVHVEDGVCSQLELLPILAKERMREILAAELSGRGFTREGEVLRRAEDGGVTTEVDLESGTVTVRVAAEVELKIERTRTARIEEERMKGAREALQKAADAEDEEAAQIAQEHARKEATSRLEAKLKDLKKELDSATNRVTAEALKERARQMGEIEEMHEDSETGELTIKVRV